MHGFLCAAHDTPFLVMELDPLALPGGPTKIQAPGWVTTADFPLPPPKLVFARQFLPEVRSVSASSIRLWAQRIIETVRHHCPAEFPWRLHLVPRYQTLNSSHAGRNRCRLIMEAVIDELRRTGRAYWRQLQPASHEPFSTDESLVQVLLTEPETGWLSVCTAPNPSVLRRWISPFPAGEIPVAEDRAAPSRAFAKLLEAEIRLGRRIAANETVIDLGACPGSWSYVALARGARVVAVDRSPVRADLLRNPRLRFHAGDAFKYEPGILAPADWLICDVIAAPERSVQLVIDWVRAQWCRHFIVTIKFKGHDEYDRLDRLKIELPGLVWDFGIARLCANKNEACVFGSTVTSAPDST